MDLSKLPKLSETQKNAPQPHPAHQPLPATNPPAVMPLGESGVGPQVWLSAILGIVFMMMGKTFASFLIAKMTGQPFHTEVIWQMGDKAGQEVDYFELSGYTAWTDAAIFLFGLATLLEGIVLMFVRRNTVVCRALVGGALLVTAGMTAFNIMVVIMLFSSGITPIMSLLVVAFGGWMTMYEWQLFRGMLLRART